MTQTLSSARKKLGEQASCLFVECTGRMPMLPVMLSPICFSQIQRFLLNLIT